MQFFYTLIFYKVFLFFRQICKEVRSLSVVMPGMNSVDKLTFLISFVIFDMKGEKLIQSITNDIFEKNDLEVH